MKGNSSALRLTCFYLGGSASLPSPPLYPPRVVYLLSVPGPTNSGGAVSSCRHHTVAAAAVQRGLEALVDQREWEADFTAFADRKVNSRP